jgi:D-arabinose 1-dehydrogenase-like Zn-dependent alcohol dehydrogenase
MTINILGYVTHSADANFKIQDINEAYRRMLKSDVKYRFVLDDFVKGMMKNGN